MENYRLTAREAADVIGVQYNTLINWKCTGAYSDVLPFHKSPNGRLYLMSKDVKKFARAFAK